MSEDFQLQRFNELSSKQVLSGGEMHELMRLSPPSTFKSLGNIADVGAVDIEKMMTALADINRRTEEALRKGSYLEALSLQLQLADFWLRLFWVNKSGKSIVIRDKDLSFGRLINHCARMGLNLQLVQRLRTFNTMRIDAIHHYVLGAITYEELKPAAEQYRAIGSQVMEYVLKEAVPIKVT